MSIIVYTIAVNSDVTKLKKSTHISMRMASVARMDMIRTITKQLADSYISVALTAVDGSVGSSIRDIYNK